jgi:hypothetical protein
MAQPTYEVVGGLDERGKGAMLKDERERRGRESPNYTGGAV